MPSKKNKNNPAPAKRSRRSNQPHPELDPRYSLKTRADLIDYDYLHKLDKAELEWLNGFTGEYVSGNLDREKPKKNLHKTKKLIKDCDDRNNARNRDILTRVKASNQLTDYEALVEESHGEDEEDRLINEIDKKEVMEAMQWLAEENEKDQVKVEKALIIEQED